MFIVKIDLTKSVSNFSLKVKILRAIWSVGVWPFFAHLPRFASPLRIWILRVFGASIGRQCMFERGIKILIPWNICFSDCVAIGRNVEIYNYGKVHISNMTVVSQYSYLCTGSHDYTHPHMPLTWAPIKIGSECWIAADVFISPGISIGNGAVIGARSVVTKDMPEWMVCAGNPCKPIKARVVKYL